MKRHIWIYHSVIIALILGSLLPFLAAFPSAISASSPTSFGDKILICTIDGYQWISKSDWDEGNIPAPSNHVKCPVCVLSAFGATTYHTPEPLIAPLTFTTQTLTPPPHRAKFLSRAAFLLSPPSHAPPHILL